MPNARDSLFASLSWAEYDELYRCKAETDRMLQYIARLEVDCLVYKRQYEECKHNCVETCKRVCAENEKIRDLHTSFDVQHSGVVSQLNDAIVRF